MKRKIFLIDVFVLLFCIFPVSLSAAEEVIKVGAPIPYTGAYASDGDEMLKGIKMAVDEINGRGGLLGKKIKIIIGDTGELEPDSIVTAIEKLITRNKVVALFTGYADTGADISAAGKYDIPFFHADTTHVSTGMVRENIGKYWNVFMMDEDEGVYGPWVFDAYTKKLKIKFENKRAAVVTSDYLYQKWISEDFRRAAVGAGWKIVVDELVPVGNTEWGTIIGKIRAKKPSLIFFSDMAPTDEASFIRQFVQKPVNAHIYINYGPSSPEFLKLAGDTANGISWATVIGPLVNTDQGKQWAKNFEEKYGSPPGFSIAAVTYDEVYVWARAVQKVGSFKDYRGICKAVLETPYRGICGTYYFDPKDQHAMSGNDKIPVHFYQVKNRKHELVILGDTMVSPYVTPPWFK